MNMKQRTGAFRPRAKRKLLFRVWYTNAECGRVWRSFLRSTLEAAELDRDAFVNVGGKWCAWITLEGDPDNEIPGSLRITSHE